MERIEINGVPVRIGERSEHFDELQTVRTCSTCTRSIPGTFCTSRMYVTEGGRIELLEVSPDDTCDLHTDLQPDVGGDGQIEVQENPM